MSRGAAVRFSAVMVSFVALVACREEAAPPLTSLKPKPLPVIDSSGAVAGDAGELDPIHQVEAVAVYGRTPPKDAAIVRLEGERFTLDGRALDVSAGGAGVRAMLGEAERPVLLSPDADTYMAQAAPLLAALDDARVRTWLAHPSGRVAFPITLSDESDFKRWLDQIVAGRVRVIHRADGFELQTNVGKLPGPDPNGPTVPRRGGEWDVARLRAGLVALEKRFDNENEGCVVPSYGMELASVAEGLTGWYTDEDEPLFAAICLVYARPASRDGG